MLDVQTAKNLMDSMYLAKRIWEQQPRLPQGMSPGMIHVLDALVQLESNGTMVCVSDISDRLGLPRPGITNSVKNLAALGYAEKSASPSDRRVIYVHTTAAGRKIHHQYVTEHFERMCAALEKVREEDAQTTVRTLQQVYNVLLGPHAETKQPEDAAAAKINRH